MARLKAEFLHQYHREHGLPLRNRAFGHVARISRWGCRLAPWSNRLVQHRLVRRLNEVFLGIDRRRVPPAFAVRSLARRIATSPNSDSDSDSDSGSGTGTAAPRVLLFPDTFANYHEPELGEAAIG